MKSTYFVKNIYFKLIGLLEHRSISKGNDAFVTFNEIYKRIIINRETEESEQILFTRFGGQTTQTPFTSSSVIPRL